MVEEGHQKRVVIVGAGAAGMSCAAQLTAHPSQFDVTVIEKGPVCGGQATSINVDSKQYGASWLNNGVQGGSPAFKHTEHIFKRYGYDWTPVQLQVSFGKGEDGFWTNVFPSKLVQRYAGDIRKFGTMLKAIRYMIPVLGLVPVKHMLALWRFSPNFGHQMVYPLIALFLGTGNQTPNVASAILERLFNDPNMKLWDYDSQTLLPNLPTMVTFPNLGDFYSDWKTDLESKGVKFRLETEVTKVLRRNAEGVVLETRPCHDATLPQDEQIQSFDELVLCVLADQALTILGKQATWREKFVLGGAKFFDDITVTHSDSEYFSKNFETGFRPHLALEPETNQQRQQLSFARGETKENPKGFLPMYYIKTYDGAPGKVEMAFDVSAYQHQFRDTKAGEVTTSIPFHKHIFQSIFLDKNLSEQWTIDHIDESKVIQKKWWHQLGHRWQHYLRVVPGMMFINNKNHTQFAGSWTLVNMHELAITSGMAAAYNLGAAYEPFDDFAEGFFKKYLLLSHGVWYKRPAEFAGKTK